MGLRVSYRGYQGTVGIGGNEGKEKARDNSEPSKTPGQGARGPVLTSPNTTSLDDNQPFASLIRG